MEAKHFVAIDFDGTVTNVDLVDSILETFARPEWREVEKLWEKGLIGSRQCLETQMSMVDCSLDKLLAYVDNFSIDKTFLDFTVFLHDHHIPYAILSDGFQVFIERLLSNAGLKGVPVYANILTDHNGKLKTLFPHSRQDCDAAHCKCMVADRLGNGLPTIVIGDGRSDYCLANKSRYVFTKSKLTEYCTTNGIPHTPFDDFISIAQRLTMLEGPVLQPWKERILNVDKAISPTF